MLSYSPLTGSIFSNASILRISGRATLVRVHCEKKTAQLKDAATVSKIAFQWPSQMRVKGGVQSASGPTAKGVGHA
jgi:hypothetical protein